MFSISYRQNNNQNTPHYSPTQQIKNATHAVADVYNHNVYRQQEIKSSDALATKATKSVINSLNLKPTKGLTGSERAEAELHNLSVITTNPFAIPAYIISNPFRK
ncbi:hypothetical protein IJE86_02345 [bacterium]|nr:hypothetical protein [bacterium]